MHHHVCMSSSSSSSISTYRNRHLLAASLAPETQKKYLTAVSQFVRWARDNEFDAKTPAELDNLLMDYIHELYYDDKSKSQASMTYYAVVCFLPTMKRRLDGSKRCIKGWFREEPSKSHPPLTWHVTLIIALQMARRGYYSMAVGTLLAFDCFLRISELLSLTRSRIADVGDLRVSTIQTNMMIRLRDTKTAPNQWVIVENDDVQLLVRDLMARERAGPVTRFGKTPDTKLFDFTASKYRYVMHDICSQLGLSVSYVPHSLRHGGATHYHHVLDWIGRLTMY